MTVCGTRWTRRVERNEWSEGDGERAEHDGRNRKGIDQRRRIDERERERVVLERVRVRWNGVRGRLYRVLNLITAISRRLCVPNISNYSGVP